MENNMAKEFMLPARVLNDMESGKMEKESDGLAKEKAINEAHNNYESAFIINYKIKD
jgi:hypothetical protein